MNELGRQATEADKTKRLAWWRESKFGVFIHWGLYAIPAGEWNGKSVPGLGEWIQHNARIPVAEYEKLAAQFHPTAFDPAAWARLVRDSGARYICLTAKHHDGFALFQSRASKFNVMDASPFRRDIVKELAVASREAGLTFCFYYSQIRDWHEPDAQGNVWDWPGRRDYTPYLERKALPQLRELLTGYGPVGLIWFDTPEGISREQSQAIAGLVRGIQPGCLLNGRLFPKRQAADYGSAPDNQGPVQVVNEPWELPATIARGTWGYRKDQVYRSLDELIFELVDVVSKGGNLLLNIGPRPDGSIPEADVERLRGMGRWLAVNGEAVYGTDATPFGTELSHRSWRCTRKANRLFVHVFAPPAKREWVLDTGRPALAARVTRARLLAPPGTVLPFACDAGRLTIRLPANMADSFPAVVALDLEKEAEP